MRYGQIKLAVVLACLSVAAMFIASPASAAQTWYECHVGEIWDGTSELPYYSVHCIEPWVFNTTSVTAFVVPTAPDRERANRFFNVAMAALLSGRLLTLMFESTEINPMCSGVDCKTAIYFGLKR